MNKKIPIVIGITFLFLGTCITPSVAIDNVKKSYYPISSGNTLYVGGSGSGNYTKIQDAINDASDGDTVFVYDDSSPYYENIWINKSINLIGENKHSTIIDGSNISYVIKINAHNVLLCNCLIRNTIYSDYTSGVYIKGNHIIIDNNNFISNWQAIRTKDTINITISNNYFYNNWCGILQKNSDDSLIIGNTFLDNTYGVNYVNSYKNNITLNTITINTFGIRLSGSTYNNITNNKIKFSRKQGIFLEYNSSWNNIISNNIISNEYNGISFTSNSSYNYIYHNNFKFNRNNAKGSCYNIWDDGEFGNYWSDYKERYPNAKRIWEQGIWDTPYGIEDNENNKDNYPLIRQWPKTRTRNTPSVQITFHPIINWFLERFPLLERLLDWIRY